MPGCSEGFYKMEGFYRQTSEWDKGATNKRKDYSWPRTPFLKVGKRKGFYQACCLFFLGGMERAPVADGLVGVDQKTPYWLIKKDYVPGTGRNYSYIRC